jgi:D-alanine transaminase
MWASTHPNPSYGDDQTMTRIVYVNGDYLPEDQAKVSVFDRGFLMADGVYEVTSVLGSRLIDYAGHAARLERSLAELGMGMPMSADDLLQVHRELVARNDLTDGMIYLQITRGNPGDRDFAYPRSRHAPDRGAVHPVQARPGGQSGGAGGHVGDFGR